MARLVPAQEAATRPRKDLHWGQVAERRQRLWGDEPVPGKPTSEVVYEARGDR